MWLEGEVSSERALGGHIGLISPLPEENSGKSGNSNQTLAFLPYFLSSVVCSGYPYQRDQLILGMVVTGLQILAQLMP